MRTKLIIAVEDTTDDVTGTLDLSDDSDLQQYSNEIDNLEDSVTTAQDSSETLDKLTGALESASALDRTSLKLTQITLESIHNKLGMPYNSSVSLEHTQYTTSLEVVEGIKKIGSKIWEGIVKAWRWMMDLLGKLFNTVGHQIKKAKENTVILKKEIFNFGKNTNLIETVLESPELASTIAIDGEANAKTAEQLMIRYNNLLKTSDWFVKMVKDTETLTSDAKDETELSERLKNFLGRAKNFEMMYVADQQHPQKELFAKGYGMTASMRVVYGVPVPWIDFKQLNNKFPKEVSLGNPIEISRLLNVTAGAISKLENFYGVSSRTFGTVKSIMGHLTKATTSSAAFLREITGASGTTVDADLENELKNTLMWVNAMIILHNKDFTVNALMGINGSLKLCKLSMKNYRITDTNSLLEHTKG